MTDALQRLSAANPVPADPGAPPIEDVRTRIAAGEPAPAGRSWRRGGRARGDGRAPRAGRWSLGAVAPVLGAIAVAAVVAGVVLAIHGHSRPANTAAPAGGMRGHVEPYAAGLAGDTGWIWFTRCTSCAGRPGATSAWLATTADGGRTWTTRRRQQLLIPPASGAGANVWAAAVGESDDVRLAGGGIVVTHDGGRRWQSVHVIRSPNPYSVSVAGGEVWAVGDGCRGGCEGSVLRGRSVGSTLSATPTMPSTGKRARQVVALGATSAYLYVPPVGGRAQAWLTTNAGRSWSRVAAGCRTDSLSGSGAGAMWRPCLPSHGHAAVGISTDGGRHWVYRAAPFSSGVLYGASARVAWTQAPGGTIARTADGGRTWQAVWSQPHGHGRPAALSVQSTTTATEVVSVTHAQDGVTRTNLVLYRTTDGGGHWARTRVPLPSR